MRLPKRNFGSRGFKQLWGSDTTCIVKLNCIAQKYKGLKPGSLYTEPSPRRLLRIPDTSRFKPFGMYKTTAF